MAKCPPGAREPLVPGVVCAACPRPPAAQPALPPGVTPRAPSLPLAPLRGSPTAFQEHAQRKHPSNQPLHLRNTGYEQRPTREPLLTCKGPQRVPAPGGAPHRGWVPGPARESGTEGLSAQGRKSRHAPPILGAAAGASTHSRPSTHHTGEGVPSKLPTRPACGWGWKRTFYPLFYICTYCLKFCFIS